MYLSVGFIFCALLTAVESYLANNFLYLISNNPRSKSINFESVNSKHQENTPKKDLDMEEKTYSLIFCRRKNPDGFNEILLGMSIYVYEYM
jgi:hypothetical protein